MSSERMTLTASEAARAAVAVKAPVLPGKIVVDVPQPAWTKDGRLRTKGRRR